MNTCVPADTGKEAIYRRVMNERAWKVASFVGVGLGAMGVMAVAVVGATRCGGEKAVPVAEVAAQPIAIDAALAAPMPADAAPPLAIDWGKLDAPVARTAAQIAEDTRRVNAASLAADEADEEDPFYAKPKTDGARLRDRIADQIGKMFVQNEAAVAVIAGGPDHTVLEFSVFGGDCTIESLRMATTGVVGKQLRAVGFKLLQCGGTEKHDGVSVRL